MNSEDMQLSENLKTKLKWSLAILLGVLALSIVVSNLIPYALGVFTGMIVSNPKELQEVVIKSKNRLKALVSG